MCLEAAYCKGCGLKLGPGHNDEEENLPDLGVMRPCMILLFPDGPNGQCSWCSWIGVVRQVYDYMMLCMLVALGTILQVLVTHGGTEVVVESWSGDIGDVVVVVVAMLKHRWSSIRYRRFSIRYGWKTRLSWIGRS